MIDFKKLNQKSKSNRLAWVVFILITSTLWLETIHVLFTR
jgi:type IV secretory pathway component VirB8